MKYLLTFILIVIYAGTFAQDYISGPQFKSASEGSVDILSSHLTLFQSQAKYNKIFSNISLTSRLSPATFLINDGAIKKGSLQRHLFNLGGGFGKASEAGIFAGMQADMALAGREEWGSNCTQYIFYLGFALAGFQADVGAMLASQGAEELDFNNEFSYIKQPDDTVYQRGTRHGTAFSVYHKSGVYFMANFTKVWINGTDYSKLADYKFSIQPLKKYLPDIYGLPFIDLVAYTRLSSYYSQYQDYYNSAFQINESEMKDKEYDISPGSDGLYKKGLRASVTFHAYPKVYFKKAELAYNYFINDKAQVCGARTQFYMREHKPNISFDAFVMLSTKSKKQTISLSYSYNSPDNTTFLPLPKLHVIGAQLIFGHRETAKAIIPYANSIMEEDD
ncbi:MAG: hypothetical protein A2275_04945 [Bacteroidetes bacterium RIFOXYA12_FULL_35_11]|nr:MAG: hypothetical protein A2X01_10500 [Bacteroidetes bacterium GWF2_35_48]OFY78241.1 MAG: hypothetical protein A2275_04945 [Bacteroidetes bacterium RIFOXYA12_FULL_35_11]OFY94915.1 MAG: hypothetical protein A2309_02270 [Bacteroidetes bacterium RIFOXYB2_FULL_35_7]OFY95199.1 MAG: hypothetical protein A2491_18850 [Bacteroidetes bacterium RIFOXYC12_FULL_35_7]HBX49921.1 hypothetical protein [Bacteroidales bacterium]